jgi:cell division septation protein DedD
MVLHSSIELSVSVKMVDTQTGEVLWQAEQTESDFQGIGKIPTSIASAILAPIQYVTNKLNLQSLVSEMTTDLTTNIKSSEQAEDNRIEDAESMITASVNAVESDNMPNPQEPGIGLGSTAEIEQTLEQKPLFINIEKESELANKKIEQSKQIKLEIVKEKQKEEIKPEPKKKPDNLMYAIQVGAYSNKNFAENLETSLIDKGYKVFISVSEKEGDEYYKVQIGRYPDREMALKTSKIMNEKEKLANFIVVIR